jgi:hypothetical protein
MGLSCRLFKCTPYRGNFGKGAFSAIACAVVWMFNSAIVSALNADQADPQPAMSI